MKPEIMAQASADDLLIVAERVGKIALELRDAAASCAGESDAERLKLAAHGVQAEAQRLAGAALETARAGERLATVASFGSES